VKERLETMESISGWSEIWHELLCRTIASLPTVISRSENTWYYVSFLVPDGILRQKSKDFLAKSD